MSSARDKIGGLVKKTAIKNVLRGIVFGGLYVVITIIIPFITFTWIQYITICGIEIGYTRERYEQIIYWVAAYGLIISGCAFFAYSSPKQSIRRGVFSLVQILLNCLYIWSYKFSGATEASFTLVGWGDLSVNVTQMILMYLGIYFLLIILKIYDLSDFVINREKIRLERRKF